jgi:MFS family permease
MSTYGLEMNLTQIVATMMVGGFGFAMFSAPNVSIVMGSVPKESTGEASAVLGVTRQGGMMVSMGLAMMVIALTMGSADHIVPERYPEFIEVIRITFIMCAGFGVVSMIASMLRKPVRRATRF